MPEDTAEEKIQLIKAFKGQGDLTDPSLGLQGSIEKARKIERENPDFYFLDQFKNVADIEFHREETAKEIKNPDTRASRCLCVRSRKRGER